MQGYEEKNWEALMNRLPHDHLYVPVCLEHSLCGYIKRKIGKL